RWTRLYLDPGGHALRPEPPKQAGSASYAALGDGLTFMSAPFEEETEITGPLAARLFLSSSTADADVFLVFRVFTPDLREVVFMGAIDPHTPVAQGWLRASHRKLDPRLSTEFRPYHSHDRPQPLEPGEVVQLDVEIWPTSIVVPAGHRVALSVRGRDYEWQRSTGARLSNFKNELRGCGPFLHDDPRDRPPELFGGRNTLHAGQGRESYVLLPVIPPKG
ncbi:MAG TPA: CocE/NonD family hydrolase C-terminal non-catalytic domain-containing protein, partial [Candidatus Dormibacteraeota bacterium]|nr:CocE/NonD family hydrolase C-terminal non-catalytic domain-containing protein [Candidatus Dormibacteraeota bacterium]